MKLLCKVLNIPRSSYYKWLNRQETEHEKVCNIIAGLILDYDESFNHILGYRRMRLFINRLNQTNYSINYVRRIMRLLGISSKIRRKRKGYKKSTPQITAENILSRNFTANKPNEKWLTDVTEFKVIGSKNKLYLSAIYDLYDRSIIAYELGNSNNNDLVFKTFDKAVKLNPNAKPIFHSDRGFQYTNKVFANKLEQQEMTQSMSRVSRCIDNGPMEGFWGILKSEMYYLNRFHNEALLRDEIVNYINFYNTQRFQENLRSMTPFEYRNHAS